MQWNKQAFLCENYSCGLFINLYCLNSMPVTNKMELFTDEIVNTVLHRCRHGQSVATMGVKCHIIKANVVQQTSKKFNIFTSDF
jgi:hypothetical protein